MTVINNFSNVIQGAVLRNQIAHAKADGKVTTAEANAILAQAKSGGVTPSELAALKELAASSRNNTSFDAGAKAALNKFVGNDANRSHASGRLPPEANLPQILGFTDKARLSALDKHFKKDDGQIGQSEARSILRNIFKDGNVSPSERQYLTSKLNDPNVTPAAKNDIRLILSLVPGSRLPVGADGIIRPKWPRALPPPPPSSTGSTASTGSTTSPSGPTTGFPTSPVPPRDPNDLAAQNMFQNMQSQFEQAVSKLISFWQGTGAVPAGATTLQGALDATAAKVQAAVANGIPAGLTVPTPPKDPKDLAAVNKYFEAVAAFDKARAGSTPQTGSTGSTGTTGGTSGTSGTSGTGSTGSTGGTQYNGSFPSYPTPPKDPKDLAAQNKFQEDMFNFQQASQNMNTFWQMMQNTLKSMGDTANNAVRNLR